MIAISIAGNVVLPSHTRDIKKQGKYQDLTWNPDMNDEKYFMLNSRLGESLILHNTITLTRIQLYKPYLILKSSHVFFQEDYSQGAFHLP